MDAITARAAIDRIRGVPPPLLPVDKQAAAKKALAVIADQYDMNAALNELADKTRLGGRFTPSGLEFADKLATQNAEDSIRAKGLLVQAATGQLGQVDNSGN